MIGNSFTFAEYNVPLAVIDRTYGFFSEIGWETRPHSTEPESVYVHPMPRGKGPIVAYWHTSNPRKLGRFESHSEPSPSGYSVGLWHPIMQETTEVALVVPDEDTVREIAERGGDLLEAHTHEPLRIHAGALEFRFTDHVNNMIRVTHFDGYEL